MKKKNDLPVLGFGCMRLPKNIDESEKLILHAISSGVDYFDVAYVYPGKEEMLGKILTKNNCRDKVKIATKLPHWLVKNPSDLDKYFNKQLERLKTDYIDYYLIHMLPDVSLWEKLNAVQWIEEKKASGKIKKIGFSYHGGSKNFMELIDAYSWDFTQIQYNYMDETAQAGKTGLDYAYKKNIPVIVMEPLRGGLLAGKLPKKAAQVFKEKNSERTPAEWGLRWLWAQDEVSCVLSGITSMDILEENIRIAHSDIEEIDIPLYEKVKKTINSSIAVPCTGCGYCMPCPANVDIPGCFRSLNASYTDGYIKAFQEYIMCTSFTKDSSNSGKCVGCNKCKEHCPQFIDIPAELIKVKNKFENPIYKLARFFIKRRI